MNLSFKITGQPENVSNYQILTLLQCLCSTINEQSPQLENYYTVPLKNVAEKNVCFDPLFHKKKLKNAREICIRLTLFRPNLVT